MAVQKRPNGHCERFLKRASILRRNRFSGGIVFYDMMEIKRKLFKKTDAILIGIILFTAALCWFFTRQNGTLESLRILYNGKVVSTVQPGADGTFTVPEAPGMVFEIKDGKVAAASSDCPDKTCVNMGYIGNPAQKIVCLPNQIVVEAGMRANDPDAPDTVTR